VNSIYQQHEALKDSCARSQRTTRSEHDLFENMDSKYHILLLGGTGICGLIFTRAALEAGHKLTLYVRTPSKIPADLTSNTNVSIIQGDLGDAEGLKIAAACGADIFISLAGPTLGKREGTVGFLELQDRSRKTNITPAYHRRPPNSLPAPSLQRHHETHSNPLHRLVLRSRRQTIDQVVLCHQLLCQSNWRGYL